MTGTRMETGGKVELLVLERRDDGSWDALARPARRLRPGVKIDFETTVATVLSSPVDGKLVVDFDAEDDEAAIEASGTMPLPPYFHGHLEEASRYQTLFASEPGSAAAPTAGLHFTPEVVTSVEESGVGFATVDLHVSLDTFRPMNTEMVEDHEMHSEWCSVSPTTQQAIAATRRKDGRVIAVGTTVVRTLETFADGKGGVQAGARRTDLFLKPGSQFHVVDGLITNFHLPGSTLLVLLAAFMGPSWRAAYDTALQRGYRFLSFGDAMFALRHAS